MKCQFNFVSETLPVRFIVVSVTISVLDYVVVCV